MSWSDDMRCLHCDGKLPLYRKITHGQFCSTAHRKAYWQDQERLAIERLHQTHNSLRAFRPSVPIESILGPIEPASPEPDLLERSLAEVHPAKAIVAAVGSTELGLAEMDSAELSGYVPTLLVPRAGSGPRMLVSDVHVYEMQQVPGAPAWILPEAGLRVLPSAAAVALTWAPPAPVSQRRLALSLSSAAELTVREVAIPVCRPVSSFSLSSLRVALAEIVEMRSAAQAVRPRLVLWAGPTGPPSVRVPEPQINLNSAQLQSAAPLSSLRMALAESVEMRFAAQAAPPDLALRTGTSEPLPVRVSEPLIGLDSTGLQLVAPEPVVEQSKPAEEQIPQANHMFPLARFASANIATSPISFPLALPLGTNTMLPDQSSQSIASARLELNMGRGRRYPIELRATDSRTAEPVPSDLSILPPEIAMPDRGAEVVLQAAEQAREAFVPEPSVALIPLSFTAERLVSKPALPRTMVVSTIPQPLCSKLILPALRLEPVNPRPVFDIPEMPAAILAEAQAEAAAQGAQVPLLQEPPAQALPAHKNVWAHASGFWKHAPRDLKILLFTIPALLVLAFHPPLPKVHFSAPAATSNVQISQNLHTAVAGQWANVRQAVLDRAAVALDEDFRAGLDDWTSRANATTGWSFDATGFVRPGPLALYRPTMNLRDYQMQFLGMIDKKALSWVVRAVDFDNYYVVKIVVLKPGPITTLGITRYAVINGKAQDRSDTIVPIDARPDMLYRVRMDVHDDSFALSVQGQMADSWSEPRLPKGGIGFFSARGEESRVRWVQVTHQYDMLGRLCAYLAPYDIPTTNGSW